ncbi:MAG: hypothetical protein JWR70_2456 [Modestobacter sp.]|nr:hypothetical protein [Modestobacter sp.]
MTITPAASTVETNDAVREAMRTALLAQGSAPADIETMLPAQEEVYRVRLAVTEAIAAMRRDLPDSEKTWAPYLRLLVDGLPGLCHAGRRAAHRLRRALCRRAAPAGRRGDPRRHRRRCTSRGRCGSPYRRR